MESSNLCVLSDDSYIIIIIIIIIMLIIIIKTLFNVGSTNIQYD